jgi:hypothetical protein
MKKKVTKKEKEILLQEWRKEMIDIINSPETRKRAEEMHKRLSYVSWEDMNRPFTI